MELPIATAGSPGKQGRKEFHLSSHTCQSQLCLPSLAGAKRRQNRTSAISYQSMCFAFCLWIQRDQSLPFHSVKSVNLRPANGPNRYQKLLPRYWVKLSQPVHTATLNKAHDQISFQSAILLRQPIIHISGQQMVGSERQTFQEIQNKEPKIETC